MKRLFAWFIFPILFIGPAVAADDNWPDLKKYWFAERDIAEDRLLVNLYVPELAADASVVPARITLAPDAITKIKNLFLIIDRNPDPLAMEMEFTDEFRNGMEIGEHSIYTRVRINEFSNIRAVMETVDGRLYMSSRFIAGAGGCSSPPGIGLKEALADLGNIRVRVSKDPNFHYHWHQAQVRIRHPNFTGMQQSEEIESGFIPARYIKTVHVYRDDRKFIQINAGISISENPVFSFNYGATGNETLRVEAIDSEGSEFSTGGTH
ncbi:MAG: quinoprotein dehydrogenase-associated SoxYZ-like carrier [Thiotrichales bacterium]|nr:quinoprotein dehydrogenase-associated SoxYZ-like carrier [Thiotrichales bacterium]